MSKVIFEIRKNTYYDSVTLMIISKEVKKIDGVYEALVGMGTDLNKELAENLNIISDEIKMIGPNDFFVTVLAEENIQINEVVEEADRLLNKKRKDSASDYMPPSISSALEYMPDSNIVLISVGGEYAAAEVRTALNNNLHVMLFSDNVSLKDERELKELACEKGLLMMGPDCGTAIINNVPLAFANVVRKGNIGVVAASGTGTQEVTVIIDKLGEGISQAIGTGGRDLREEIGGLMMLQAIEALKNDIETKVIVLISKPPSDEVTKKIMKAIENSQKPVVVDFIGGDRDIIEAHGGYACVSLEDAARKAVAILRGKEVKDFESFYMEAEKIEKIILQETNNISASQKYLRGFFTGGTLADETMKILSPIIGPIYSNIPLQTQYKLTSTKVSNKNTCIDFGEDEFTVGKPHPMIDPTARVERLEVESNDDEIAVVLLDFVLGYGSHEDPIGEMLPSIEAAKKRFCDKGNYLCVIGSVCGTENDPQNLVDSQRRLEEAGVIVLPSNAQAARLAGMILKKIL